MKNSYIKIPHQQSKTHINKHIFTHTYTHTLSLKLNQCRVGAQSLGKCTRSLGANPVAPETGAGGYRGYVWKMCEWRREHKIRKHDLLISFSCVFSMPVFSPGQNSYILIYIYLDLISIAFLIIDSTHLFSFHILVFWFCRKRWPSIYLPSMKISIIISSPPSLLFLLCNHPFFFFRSPSPFSHLLQLK